MEQGTNGEFQFDCPPGQIYQCRHCGENYTDYPDPFIVIYDANYQPNPKQITYEYCTACLRNVFQCCWDCGRTLDEPWDSVYVVDPEKKDSKVFYCTCCWNDPRNKWFHNCHNGRCPHCGPEIQKGDRGWPSPNNTQVHNMNFPPKKKNKKQINK